MIIIVVITVMIPRSYNNNFVKWCFVCVIKQIVKVTHRL